MPCPPGLLLPRVRDTPMCNTSSCTAYAPIRQKVQQTQSGLSERRTAGLHKTAPAAGIPTTGAVWPGMNYVFAVPVPAGRKTSCGRSILRHPSRPVNSLSMLVSSSSANSSRRTRSGQESPRSHLETACGVTPIRAATRFCVSPCRRRPSAMRIPTCSG